MLYNPCRLSSFITLRPNDFQTLLLFSFRLWSSDPLSLSLSVSLSLILSIPTSITDVDVFFLGISYWLGNFIVSVFLFIDRFSFSSIRFSFSWWWWLGCGKVVLMMTVMELEEVEEAEEMVNLMFKFQVIPWTIE